MKSIIAVLPTLVLAGIANADEPPVRVEDQIFLHLHGGTALADAHITYTNAPAVDSSGTGGWNAGLGIRFDPNDYIGLDSSIDLLGWNAGTVMGTSYTGGGIWIGPSLRLSIPLRYIKPYAGIGGVGFIDQASASNPMTGESDSRMRLGFTASYIAGVDVYLRRDFRVFAEYRSMNRADEIDPDFDMASDVRTQALSFGLLYSPKSLRQSTPNRKFGVVGGSILGAAALAATYLLIDTLTPNQ